MSKYTLTISSKNKDSINQILKFFNNNKKQNSQIYTKLFRQKKVKEKISVLKSPHVNKTAQEQFKYIHYYITITFKSITITITFPRTRKEVFLRVLL